MVSVEIISRIIDIFDAIYETNQRTQSISNRNGAE